LQTLLDNLKKRGFIPVLLQDGEQAAQYILQHIPAGATVGFGGSVTVEQLQIPTLLERGGLKCNSTKTSQLSWEQLCLENRHAEYYITSTNAISREGILVNIDGRSNRISAMCYGPRELFFVLGTNKITKTLGEAINRAQNVAAPLNAKRLNRKTPCVKTGKCSDCLSPDTICKAMLVLYHPTSTVKTHIIIINKELGY